MSKKKKLLQRLLAIPKDLRFEDLEKVLYQCGYLLCRTQGSHAIFIKPGGLTLTIPIKTPVKSYLINQVLLAIEDCIEEVL